MNLALVAIHLNYRGLDKDLYLEFKSELDKKIFDLNQKLEKSGSKISNLQKCIFVSGVVAQNLSNYWASGSMDVKLRLQKLIFPEGITIDVKNRAFRTKKMNMMFDVKPRKSSGWETVNENSQVNFTWESLLVEKSPNIPNQVTSFLCLSDTKNVNSITLFSQLQKDLIAIEDYHRYVKAVARGY